MIRQATITLVMLTTALTARGLADHNLARSFANPPESARAWCYWWWLNGAASKEGITRDFEEMKRQGISGALLFDAGEAGPPAPRGPHFMSHEWREMKPPFPRPPVRPNGCSRSLPQKQIPSSQKQIPSSFI